jgi:hypothetical protein
MVKVVGATWPCEVSHQDESEEKNEDNEQDYCNE